jgi:2-methylisocitrate lyase-like PEP mutase family enzyme
VPLLVDIDTGYGDAASAVNAVQQLAAAGAAGVIVEDQTFPKRCGLLDKEVVPQLEFEAKLRAVASNRPHHDFVVVARTDSIATEGIQGAARRASAFHACGADLAYVQGLRSVDDLHVIASRVPGPKLIPVPRFDAAPGPAELAELGYGWQVLSSVTESAVVGSLRQNVARALAGQEVPTDVNAAVLGALFDQDQWTSMVERFP